MPSCEFARRHWSKSHKMKLLLVTAFAFLQLVSFGQSDVLEQVFFGGQIVDLPEIDVEDRTVISTQVEYETLFSTSEKALPVIDFEQYNLHAFVTCSWCIHCPVDNQECHRNACSYKPTWVLMEKSSEGEVWSGDAENDKRLLGTWQLVEFEGKPYRHKLPDSPDTWTFFSTAIEMHVDQQFFRGVFQTKVGGEVSQMQIALNDEPAGGQCIYKFEGEFIILKLCDSGNKGFASDFEPASNYDLYKFKFLR